MKRRVKEWRSKLWNACSSVRQDESCVHASLREAGQHSFDSVQPVAAVTEAHPISLRRAQSELVLRIHVKDLYGSPADGRLANDVDAAPPEVFLPVFASRMKQFGDRFRLRI